LEEEPKIACSSAFINEVFDGNGDCGEKCMCDTNCGCRNSETQEGGEENPSQVKTVQEPGDIARLAEMGLFG
jgi:hypothetical protein